jgi:hypothetical protein
MLQCSMIKYQDVGCPKSVIVLKWNAAEGRTFDVGQIIAVFQIINNIIA